MIEGYNNKIPLYNGKTKFTTTSTPSFIYFGGQYYGGVYNTNIFKYNQSSIIWEKAYNIGATSGPGGTYINAICADSSGYLWTASGLSDTDAYRIVKYDTDGTALIYGTSSSPVYAIETDSQNNIVLCGGNSAGLSIYKYDTNFNQIWSFGTSSTSFNRLNFTTSGDIVASSTIGNVVKLNSNGTCLMSKSYAYNGGVYSSCVDSSGNIWLGAQGGTYNLYKHDSNGNLLSSYYIGPGSTDIVYELTADTSGYIYASSNAYLYKVSSTGSTIWSYNPGAPASVPRTKCLVYKNGYIHLLSNSSPKFKVYNTSGALSFSFDIVQANTVNVQPI